MLLVQKAAVIFGARGEIGSTVAGRLAREGATVFLSGRNFGPVEQVVNQIRAAHGRVEAAQVDTMDEQAIQTYLDNVIRQAGHIDIVFNATGLLLPHQEAK